MTAPSKPEQKRGASPQYCWTFASWFAQHDEHAWTAWQSMLKPGAQLCSQTEALSSRCRVQPQSHLGTEGGHVLMKMKVQKKEGLQSVQSGKACRILAVVEVIHHVPDLHRPRSASGCQGNFSTPAVHGGPHVFLRQQ